MDGTDQETIRTFHTIRNDTQRLPAFSEVTSHTDLQAASMGLGHGKLGHEESYQETTKSLERLPTKKFKAPRKSRNADFTLVSIDCSRPTPPKPMLPQHVLKKAFSDEWSQDFQQAGAAPRLQGVVNPVFATQRSKVPLPMRENVMTVKTTSCNPILPERPCVLGAEDSYGLQSPSPEYPVSRDTDIGKSLQQRLFVGIKGREDFEKSSYAESGGYVKV